MARPLAKPEPEDDKGTSSILPRSDPLPSAVFATALMRRTLSLLRPIAPQMVPLAVCLSLIPVIVLSSMFSGWYVWKNVAVGWEIPVYLQYGDGVSPYAELSLPPLSATQPYDISLHLVVPASEANFALGNFMATLSLYTPSNKTLMTTKRPSIALPPPSRRRFLLSSSPRLVDLDIPLLASYVLGTSKVNARIDIGRRDEWKSLGSGEGRELSVWTALLRGAVRRHGVRGLVSRFPLTFAVGSSITFFIVSSLVLAACVLPAIQWRFSDDETATDLHSYEGNPKEERPFRTRRRQRKVVASESIHKTEDDPVDIPPAFTSDDYPLKRRRSHTSDALYDSES
ncbi:hypothetical protein PAXRUDRAFT_834327 [Paxillus rubicundulus Ve08.2h10]|uniref:Seipin n=1 Tax=Paxillus rubicundulus Ve08.2h10 TaxID=930991 RepID=A0A0D0DL40_9AGAM|nr:hypothetical protein PAXRUDRAFT_834327 [Paxillus rubicundulus Ve08.2h10]